MLHKDFKGLLKCAGGKLPGDILMLLFSCISAFQLVFVFASLVLRALETNWLVCVAQWSLVKVALVGV